jgi:hypothetical protein
MKPLQCRQGSLLPLVQPVSLGTYWESDQTASEKANPPSYWVVAYEFPKYRWLDLQAKCHPNAVELKRVNGLSGGLHKFA